jgi:hypothetical protein
MPCDYKDYPSNWKILRKAILSRARHKCELCYAPNGFLVFRFKNNHDYPWSLRKYVEGTETKIVLTIHHIDFDKKNSNLLNLIALCQRCHLKLDMQRHVTNRRKKHEVMGTEEVSRG